MLNRLSDPERVETYQRRASAFYTAYREGVVRYRNEQDDVL